MRFRGLFVLIFLMLSVISCKRPSRPVPSPRHIIETPTEMPGAVSRELQLILEYAAQNKGDVNDSTRLYMTEAVAGFYESNGYRPVWSDTMVWLPRADSLLAYVSSCLKDGLFPEDYQWPRIDSLHRQLQDSVNRKNALLWSTAELLYTDVFMHLIQDLRQGRLQDDSSALYHDPGKRAHFFNPMLQLFIDSAGLSLVLDSVQPRHPGYRNLKSGLKDFLKHMEKKPFTYVDFPIKKELPGDSLRFVDSLLQRLHEDHIEYFAGGHRPDSLFLSEMIRDYQKKHKLTVDGKAGKEVISSMNSSPEEKFKRIAITLDRFKQLPGSLPDRYIWVNLPEYKLYVHDHDSLVMESRVICGKPVTPTPLVTSSIHELVVYPTWTVPESIIKKEMLPALKRNPKYLEKKGLYLLNGKGEKIRSDSINWKKYKNGIPFRIQQGSGEDNSLGVLKFNFHNPYDVYLHDTDQRHLFRNARRCLSHGCVRVQEWQRLAAEVLRHDSLYRAPAEVMRVLPDSISSLISKQKHHRISIKNRIPLFIRYFSCLAPEGKVQFHDDIYNLDKELRDKYFSSKAILPYLRQAL